MPAPYRSNTRRFVYGGSGGGRRPGARETFAGVRDDRSRLVTGGGGGRWTLLCLSGSLSEVWRYDHGATLTDVRVGADGTVYVAGKANADGAEVAAVTAAGALVWEADQPAVATGHVPVDDWPSIEVVGADLYVVTRTIFTPTSDYSSQICRRNAIDGAVVSAIGVSSGGSPTVRSAAGDLLTPTGSYGEAPGGVLHRIGFDLDSTDPRTSTWITVPSGTTVGGGLWSGIAEVGGMPYATMPWRHPSGTPRGWAILPFDPAVSDPGPDTYLGTPLIADRPLTNGLGDSLAYRGLAALEGDLVCCGVPYAGRNAFRITTAGAIVWSVDTGDFLDSCAIDSQGRVVCVGRSEDREAAVVLVLDPDDGTLIVRKRWTGSRLYRVATFGDRVYAVGRDARQTTGFPSVEPRCDYPGDNLAISGE